MTIFTIKNQSPTGLRFGQYNEESQIYPKWPLDR